MKTLVGLFWLALFALVALIAANIYAGSFYLTY